MCVFVCEFVYLYDCVCDIDDILYYNIYTISVISISYRPQFNRILVFKITSGKFSLTTLSYIFNNLVFFIFYLFEVYQIMCTTPVLDIGYKHNSDIP